MKIGAQAIGDHEPPYVIAELGVNHDGSLEVALDLVRAAASAGADAVKLQYFRTDLLMSRAAKLAAYQHAAGETDPVSMLRRLEFPLAHMERAVSLAHQLGLHAIVTVFSTELVSEAESVAFDAYKTASPDLINRPLLDALAATGKPLVVSTGASTLQEVGRALNWLRGSHERLALLQCVSAYPTPIEQNGILGMRAIADIFPGAVGYSDHTTDVRTGSAAVTLGAALLEKHLTHDRAAQGPDHAASLDPAQFAEYVEMCNDAWKVEQAKRDILRNLRGSRKKGAKRLLAEAEEAFGDMQSLSDSPDRTVPIVKEVLPIERDVRTVSRQSVVSRRALPAGAVLTRDDLTIKRPGTGIPPAEISGVVGRILARPVEEDMPLTFDDLAA
jgi:N,N'-diacetyllegionaminate synthase